MDNCIKFLKFMRYLLDDKSLAEKGAVIIKALLKAQSPRLTNISEKMACNSVSNYKVIQRFLKHVDLKKLRRRLYQENADLSLAIRPKWSGIRLPRPLCRRIE
jgi:hypothetical protein